MALHPSLRSRSLKKHRSVLKRYERIKLLKDEEKWEEGDSPFGLAKIKILKIKVRKEKPAEAAPAAEEAAAAEKAAEGTEAAPRADKSKK